MGRCFFVVLKTGSQRLKEVQLGNVLLTDGLVWKGLFYVLFALIIKISVFLFHKDVKKEKAFLNFKDYIRSFQQ